MSHFLSRTLAGSALVLAAGVAHAAVDQTWSTDGSSDVAVTGWTAPDASTLLQSGTVTHWYGGVGVNTGVADESSPRHAVDNYRKNESLLLDFGGKEVNLTGVSIGWTVSGTGFNRWGGLRDANPVSDLFVLAYTGSAGFSSADMAGRSYSQLLSNGWEIVANHNGSGARTAGIASATPIYSSFWLIGAGAFQATAGGGITTGDGRYDFVKIAGVSGSVREVPPGSLPEPGSLALLGVGLAGLMALRRRPAAWPYGSRTGSVRCNSMPVGDTAAPSATTSTPAAIASRRARP